MRISENKLTLEIISDTLLVLGCLAALFLYLEYSQEISEQLNQIIASVLEDLNASSIN
jgi:hypothetical protein